MPSRGLAWCFLITTAVVHPQPTTEAPHLCQTSLRAVMGLKPQTSLNSVAIHRCLELQPGRQSQILERACEFTPVMARHLRKGERFQKGFGFAALMQGDFALHQQPAEIRLRRLRNSVIQRETMTRRNKCAQAHGQKAQCRQGARNCSTRIRDAMAQPLQVACNVGSTNSLVQHEQPCPEGRTLPPLIKPFP